MPRPKDFPDDPDQIRRPRQERIMYAKADAPFVLQFFAKHVAKLPLNTPVSVGMMVKPGVHKCRLVESVPDRPALKAGVWGAMKFTDLMEAPEPPAQEEAPV